MHSSDISAKERTVWYSFIIAAVFLEDKQTFPQPAEGTICFQTTGLLPDTLSAALNSSFLLLFHDETCSLTLWFVHKSNVPFSFYSKKIADKQGGFVILLFKIKRCCMFQDKTLEYSADLSSCETSRCNFTGVRQGWPRSWMNKHINQAPEILDLFIAHHRWINSILIKIDLGQSNGLVSCLVLCPNYGGRKYYNLV